MKPAGVWAYPCPKCRRFFTVPRFAAHVAACSATTTIN